MQRGAQGAAFYRVCVHHKGYCAPQLYDGTFPDLSEKIVLS